MEEGTRILTLAPGQEVTDVVSFETAFGDHSSFRGKGRARRQKRKMQRISNKTDRKVAKQGMRGAKKRAKGARKTEAMEIRQNRRTERKTLRSDRKNIGQEEIPEEEVLMQKEATASDDSPSEAEEVVAAGPTGGAASPDMGTPDNGGYEDPATPGSDAEEEEQDSEDAEAGYDDEEAGDDEESGFDGTGSSMDFAMEDFSGFDGDEMASYFIAPGGARMQVNRPVQGLVTQIQYEKAKMSNPKLEEAKRQAAAQRMNNLNGILSKYQRPTGYNARYAGVRKEEVAAAHNHLFNYLTRKRNARNDFGGTEQQGGSGEMGFSSTKTPIVKNNITVVTPSLDPKFSDQRIEVPASSAEGDYPTRIVELSSSAEGGSSKINWKLVAMGAGLAVAGIWAWNQYYGKAKKA